MNHRTFILYEDGKEILRFDNNFTKGNSNYEKDLSCFLFRLEEKGIIDGKRFLNRLKSIEGITFSDMVSYFMNPKAWSFK